MKHVQAPCRGSVMKMAGPQLQLGPQIVDKASEQRDRRQEGRSRKRFAVMRPAAEILGLQPRIRRETSRRAQQQMAKYSGVRDPFPSPLKPEGLLTLCEGSLLQEALAFFAYYLIDGDQPVPVRRFLVRRLVCLHGVAQVGVEDGLGPGFVDGDLVIL